MSVQASFADTSAPCVAWASGQPDCSQLSTVCISERYSAVVRVPGGYIKDLKSHWSRMFAKKIAQPTTTVTPVKARGSSEPGSWLSKYVLPTKPPTKATTAAPTKALAPPMLAKKGKAPKHSLF